MAVTNARNVITALFAVLSRILAFIYKYSHAKSVETSEFYSLMPSSSSFPSLGDVQMTTESYVECGASQEFETAQHVVNIILLAGCVLGTALNILAVICAVELFRKSSDTMHVFVVLMTVGDTILTGFAYPTSTLISLAPGIGSRPLCEAMHFAQWTGQAVSGMSLTALNLDKFIYFAHPLKYRLFTGKCAMAVSLAISVLSLGFVASLWISRTARIVKGCGFWIPPSRNYVYDLPVAIFTVVPLISSVLLSSYLCVLTRRRTIAKRQAQSGLRAKLESLGVIFATTAWTALTLPPYRVFLLVEVHDSTSEISCAKLVTLNWAALGVFSALVVNAILNPLLTMSVYPRYRRTLLSLMSFKRNRSA